MHFCQQDIQRVYQNKSDRKYGQERKDKNTEKKSFLYVFAKYCNVANIWQMYCMIFYHSQLMYFDFPFHFMFIRHTQLKEMQSNIAT